MEVQKAGCMLKRAGCRMYTEKVRLRLDAKKNPIPGISHYRDEQQSTWMSYAKVEMGFLIMAVATS